MLAAIGRTARRWFADDTDYPATWEPGGADFLSATPDEPGAPPGLVPRLVRAVPARLGGEVPASLSTPVFDIDSADAQGAHLHGLNLHRAHAWRVLAEQLPEGDPRAAAWWACAERHAAASLPDGGPPAMKA